MTQTLQSKGLTQGDQVVVTGSLNEAKWKDRNTDEWKSRVEVWAHNVDFVSRAGNDTSARAVDSYEDIPF